MIALNFPQQSIDWIIARLWRLTASNADTVITSTGKLSRSKASIAAVDKLIAGIDLASYLQSEDGQLRIENMTEWELQDFIANFTGNKFRGNLHTKRGNDLEADAIAVLSDKAGISFEDVGMCVMGEDVNTSVVSCSPDGLGRDSQGNLFTGCEVKSPTLSTYYGMIADKILPNDYKIQVHFNMAVCEVESWHFGAYFIGKPIFHLEVKRDKMTDDIQNSLIEFKEFYQERYNIVQDALSELEHKKKGKEVA